MLKSYYEADNVASVATIAPVYGEEDTKVSEDSISTDSVTINGSCTLQNSEILANLAIKFSHLSQLQQQQVSSLLLEFVDLFLDTPGRTSCVHHNVEVMGATSIKQHPYPVNPVKLQFLRKEVDYILGNGIIELSSSEWSSPCVLVPKSNEAYHFCTDYRKVNAVTKSDSYSIPRIEDCIDRIGVSKFVSKFDLLKGYW